MGLLLLWLQFECNGDSKAHKDILKHWLILPGMMYDQRCRAREEASHRPNLVPVFGLERDPWDEERPQGEPFHLCGVR